MDTAVQGTCSYLRSLNINVKDPVHSAVTKVFPFIDMARGTNNFATITSTTESKSTTDIELSVNY